MIIYLLHLFHIFTLILNILNGMLDFRGVNRSWTEERIRGEAWTEDRIGLRPV